MMSGSILHVSQDSLRTGNKWTASPLSICVDLIERTSITQSKSIGDAFRGLLIDDNLYQCSGSGRSRCDPT